MKEIRDLIDVGNFPDLSEQELIVKLLDDVIISHFFSKFHGDYPNFDKLPSTIIESLRVIEITRRRNPNFSITVFTANYIDENIEKIFM